MNASERLNSDFRGTHLTIGRHPMAFHRDKLNVLGVTPARELKFIAQWPPRSHRRLHHLPPAAGNRQRAAVPEHRR